MIHLQTPVQAVKGVGEKRAKLFERLGVRLVGDLLRFYPRSYEDWNGLSSFADVPRGVPCCVRGFVSCRPVAHRLPGGKTVYKTVITDGHTLLNVNIWNNKFAAAKLKEGEEYLFWGKITPGYLGAPELSSPRAEPAQTGGGIRPVYPLTEGLSSKTIEICVRNIFADMREADIPECLPLPIRTEYALCGGARALRQIHFPQDPEALEEARRRLVFEELFLLQVGLLRLRAGRQRETANVLKSDCSGAFFQSLPFPPTNAQRRAVAAAAADMAGEIPMRRLLQGDVGSGKTLVAAALIYAAAKNALQSAMMAPTEILAQQHFQTLRRLFQNTDIRVALLTGAVPSSEKRAVRAALASGETDVLVGTHALIQKDVVFHRLGLVVTDEQHRFGVRQRAALADKGENPHTLVMSATPIPRTLAMMIYGDLDVSVLDEMPPGRKKISTYCVDSRYRNRVYQFIKKHAAQKQQAYIVCPLVEEGEGGLAAAREYARMLETGPLSAVRVGLLHGRMKNAEKESVMTDFCQGEIDVLVSTTVIEVGVDVPNAVLMVIENAERFGLSQLHQLRGRVGRGALDAFCILISDAENGEAKKRLQVLCETADGFLVAEKDLELRGPGDFFGSRQHGLPPLRIADMMRDTVILEQARTAAGRLMELDPELVRPEHTALRDAAEALLASGEI
jgi:ATP-dependent DNA helicase RecG